MSGQLYYVVGQHCWYHRKGSVDAVKILEGPRVLAGNHGHQYKVRDIDSGREEWCHESWLCFTREEALARREGWHRQENPETKARTKMESA